MRPTLVLCLLMLASCGGNSGAGDGGILDFGPGNCSVPGVDPACGKTCTGDTDCPDSLFCNMGMCVAVCTAQQACPQGYLCAKGRCLHINGNPQPENCQGLECQQVDCPMGVPSTTLTGTVFAPNGTLPLYNAIVYVPNAPLSPIPEGVSCDVCGANTSGKPIAATITTTDGTFTLKNVPVSTDVPLVIQVGKWRREIKVPGKITACTEQPVPPAITRLPTTKMEGNIPKMAIATGNADPFECLLRKIGIADSEITHPSMNGRVHFYRLNGRNMNPPVPQANDATMGLYSDLNKLKTYDVVMLPCEGNPNLTNKSDPQLQNIVDYTTAGGRIFVTHYSYTWLQRLANNAPNAPFPGVATWQLDTMPFPSGDFFGTIDTSFPKGAAFSAWLGHVGALVTAAGPGQGKLDIQDARLDVTSVMDPPSKRWVYSNTGNQPNVVQHFTFNTPLMGAPLDDGGMPIQCGRVVFSDFHVSAGAASGSTFPASCQGNTLSAQEKALAFMLFDLSACVQDDNKPVEPPIF